MPIIQDISVAVGLLAILLLALEGGFRAGRRAATEADSRAQGQVGAVQGAVLGLLGLLLAFSFSAAGTRFLERQDLIVTEANAIGTAYLRADLLEEPHRSELRAALQRYTVHRVEISDHLRRGPTPEALTEIEGLHERMWTAATAGVAARPTALLAVVQPVNDIIDLHSIRMAAGNKHLPMLVMGLLMASSVLAIGVIGYGSGLGGRRRAPLCVPLAILIATALWITFDLDHPRAGLLQLNDSPIKSLKFANAPR